jgi:hypothetical protein
VNFIMGYGILATASKAGKTFHCFTKGFDSTEYVGQEI